MKNYKLQISEGFKDIYGAKMIIKHHLEQTSLSIFKSHGFEHLKTPAVEYIDVYSNTGIQKPDLYNLINRQGEVLSLCNDMTMSIARFLSGYEYRLKRFCYISDVFRYPKIYQGKSHQFTQAGIELVGKSGINIDAECIYIAHKTLKSLISDNFTIHLSSAKLVELLLKSYSLDDNTLKLILEQLENKDYILLKKYLLANLEEDKANFFYNMMLKGGRINYLLNLKASVEDFEVLKEFDYLIDLYNILKSLGVDNIIFDFSIYSSSKYYTDVIFNAYVKNLGKEVLIGGRVSNLYESFKSTSSDVGFALDIDLLTDYVLENNLCKFNTNKILSVINCDIALAIKNNEKLINSGAIVENYYDNDEVNYAKENNFSQIIYYNSDEIKVVNP